MDCQGADETTTVGRVNMPMTDKQINGNKNGKDESLDNSFLKKLFRRGKNFRFRKLDDVEGPLYIDPHLIDKLEQTNKCNLHTI